MIVDQHDDEFYSFLHGGHDFRGHHLVRAVPEKHKYFAAGIGHFCADGSGNFITHAGVAILHVITIRRAGGPKFVQVARMTAGS